MSTSDKNQEKPVELLEHTSGEAEQPFEWAVGRYGSKFLAEVRDRKRLLGIKCPKCGFVFVPPRRVCRTCFVQMEELVELGTEGVIQGFTVLNFSFIDPITGKKKPVPYGYVYVKLDGADSTFPHFLKETDWKAIKNGMRVRAVFEQERTGSLLDIRHFEIIPE